MASRFNRAKFSVVGHADGAAQRAAVTTKVLRVVSRIYRGPGSA